MHTHTYTHNKTVRHMTVYTHTHTQVHSSERGSAPIFKSTLIELVSPEASPLKRPLTVLLLGLILLKEQSS